MDRTKKFTHVSLCAGYGGIDLGLHRAIQNLRTIAYSEIEGFAVANLVSKMESGFLDAAPVWTNLKTFPWQTFRDRVFILSGGYPCQPFSCAGKRKGKADPRHLWPFIRDGIRTARPVFCFFENVEGHLSLGFREVQQSLRRLGYAVEAGIFSASECGATHQRKRLFILAYRIGSENYAFRGFDESEWNPLGRYSETAQRENGEASANCVDRCSEDLWPSRPGREQQIWEPPRVMADPCEHGRNWWRNRFSRWRGEQTETLRPPDTYGGSKSDGMLKTEPAMGGNVDGVADWMGYADLCISSDSRTDELRSCGNGVVPSTAQKAFGVLCAKLMRACHGEHELVG